MNYRDRKESRVPVAAQDKRDVTGSRARDQVEEGGFSFPVVEAWFVGVLVVRTCRQGIRTDSKSGGATNVPRRRVKALFNSVPGSMVDRFGFPQPPYHGKCREDLHSGKRIRTSLSIVLLWP